MLLCVTFEIKVNSIPKSIQNKCVILNLSKAMTSFCVKPASLLRSSDFDGNISILIISQSDPRLKPRYLNHFLSFGKRYLSPLGDVHKLRLQISRIFDFLPPVVCMWFALIIPPKLLDLQPLHPLPFDWY